MDQEYGSLTGQCPKVFEDFRGKSSKSGNFRTNLVEERSFSVCNTQVYNY